MLTQVLKRNFSRLVFAKEPYIRTKTLSGIKLAVQQEVQEKEDNIHGLESRQWFLKNRETGEFLSPWHDVELESAIDEEFTVTGVIEITQGTTKKLECMKEIPNNPIMQDYKKAAGGQYQHRAYAKPPQFNYGFIP